MRPTLIIPAAGSGTRFGSALPKQFLDLAGQPVLLRSLNAFAGLVGEAVVAVNAAWRPEVEAIAARSPVPVRVVGGGETRQASVMAALAAVAPGCQAVLVHDAVRPLVPRACIEACIAALAEAPAAVVAEPCASTVKQEGPSGRVAATVPRGGLWLAQTPQGLRLPEAAAAFARAAAEGWDCTDDAQVMERAGHAVRLVRGSPRNLKITTPEDLALAAALLAAGG